MEVYQRLSQIQGELRDQEFDSIIKSVNEKEEEKSRQGW
jgi:hypothetical protein